MDLSSTARVAQIIQNLTVAIASTVGGVWALLRLRRERTYEGALKIEIRANEIDAEKFTFLEVTLTNQGHAKLQANEGAGTAPVYSDLLESIRHSCSLQIKKVDTHSENFGASIDWYDSKLLSVAVPDINLLTDYQNPDKDKVEFWMEPSETYRLGALICLPPGLYLARVIFVGADNREDFWSQMSWFQVSVGSKN